MMNSNGNMFFGGVFMWIFWILLAVVIVWVVKASMSDSAKSLNLPDGNSPLEILKKRYAQGEIDDSEYKRLRDELEKQ